MPGSTEERIREAGQGRTPRRGQVQRQESDGLQIDGESMSANTGAILDSSHDLVLTSVKDGVEVLLLQAKAIGELGPAPGNSASPAHVRYRQAMRQQLASFSSFQSDETIVS